MGEIVKVLDNDLAKGLRVELNQYFNDPKRLTIHLQNDAGRFEMSDDEFCSLLAAFLIADYNRKIIKDE